MKSIVGLLALLFCALASGRVSACTVSRIAGPPSLPFRLEEPAIATMGFSHQQVFADDAFVHFVLVGNGPPPPQNSGYHGCGRTRLLGPGWSAPLRDITADGLAEAVNTLVRHGIPRSMISSRLTTGTTYTDSHDWNVRIGQILVRVDPRNGSANVKTFKVLDKAYDDDALYGLRIAGYALHMRSCYLDDRVQTAAVRDATARARELTSGFGAESTGSITSDVTVRDDGADAMQTCGDQFWPQIPKWESANLVIDQMVGLALPDAPQYVASYRANTVSRVQGEPLEDAPSGEVVTSTLPALSTPTEYARSFTVRLRQPFVAAYGTFRVIVKPDAIVVSIIHRGIDKVSMADVASWLVKQGFAKSSITVRHDLADLLIANGTRSTGLLHDRDWVQVRIAPSSDEALQKATAVGDAFQGRVMANVFPLVNDCAQVRAMAVRGAMADANRRARVMAAAAGATIGAFVGVEDVGRSTDGLCKRDSLFESYPTFRDSNDVEFRQKGGGSVERPP